jgi:hypothetical protein
MREVRRDRALKMLVLPEHAKGGDKWTTNRSHFDR